MSIINLVLSKFVSKWSYWN